MTSLRQIRSEILEAVELSREIQTLSSRLDSSLESHRAVLDAIRADTGGLLEKSDVHHKRMLDALRIVRDHDAAARAKLLEIRRQASYEQAFSEAEPLVSVVIPTFDNWKLLGERSIPSVLAQSYPRWECIVVGDAAPEETESVVASFNDDRVRFMNLSYRGPYPTDPSAAWLVSGTPPWNAGFVAARGAWIASNADDDAFRPDALEVLVKHAQRSCAEVAYGCLHEHFPDDPDDILGSFPPDWGQWGMQASLFHGSLRFLALDPSDWLFEIPNDMSLLERMLRIGIRFSMVDEIIVDYYPSSWWRSDKAGTRGRELRR